MNLMYANQGEEVKFFKQIITDCFYLKIYCLKRSPEKYPLKAQIRTRAFGGFRQDSPEITEFTNDLRPCDTTDKA